MDSSHLLFITSSSASALRKHLSVLQHLQGCLAMTHNNTTGIKTSILHSCWHRVKLPIPLALICCDNSFMICCPVSPASKQTGGRWEWPGASWAILNTSGEGEHCGSRADDSCLRFYLRRINPRSRAAAVCTPPVRPLPTIFVSMTTRVQQSCPHPMPKTVILKVGSGAQWGASEAL